MKKTFFFLLLLPLGSWVQRCSVSGYITDVETGESLIGANVLNLPSREGSAANTYGFYSLILSGDSVFLRYSYLGYKSHQTAFKLQKDTVLNISLHAANKLEEVVLSADWPIEETTQMSLVDLSVAQIKALPALLGEVDVAEGHPTVARRTERFGGQQRAVRTRWRANQNIILLDGVPVYNASYLFGFFSVFNADAINKVELVKGGFPARYGGHISSVIDVFMKEGNIKVEPIITMAMCSFNFLSASTTYYVTT